MAAPLIYGGAALLSKELAKRALRKKLVEGAKVGAGTAALAAGAAGVGEMLVNKPKKREESRMGSSKNVNAGTGRGTTEYKPSKPAAKAPQKRAVERKPESEYVAPSSPESAQTAGIRGLEGGPSGMSAEREMETGRTTYFGESPEDAVEVAQRMRKGLFGEDIPEDVYQEMERKNKEAGFYGRFKKGGSVKKKPAKRYASGGSVSSASKRGDGCAQRGKTKGRMV